MTTRLRLFDKDECPFCWKARIALAELGIRYERITLGPDDDRRELNQLSSNGTTPVLVDGSGPIWESSVILEFLNDVGQGRLLPGGHGAKARARLLHHYSDHVVGKSLREVVFEKRSKPKAEWDLARIEAGEAGWRACLDWLEAVLRKRTYFAEDFSMAECALFPRFALAERYGVGVDERHAGLLCWYAHMKERPSCWQTRPGSWLGKAAE